MRLPSILNVCVTHRFAVCLLQKFHGLLPFVLFVLLTHLQWRSLLLVFYVLRWESQYLYLLAIVNHYDSKLIKCDTLHDSK